MGERTVQNNNIAAYTCKMHNNIVICYTWCMCYCLVMMRNCYIYEIKEQFKKIILLFIRIKCLIIYVIMHKLFIYCFVSKHMQNGLYLKNHEILYNLIYGMVFEKII